MAAKKPVYQFLSSNGDGTGTTDWIGDYTTPDIGYIQPASNDIIQIYRMIVSIRDNANFAAETYGGLSELSNGIIIRISDDSGVLHTITPISVTNVSEWAKYCYDLDYKDFGAGDNFLTIRWTFATAGQPFVLDNRDDSNPRLEAVFQDNLTGLVHHRFCVQGKYGDEPF